jgi:thioredoxin reductase (NADPH)
VFDVLVIGAGPAGLTCAINSAAEGLSVMVVESGASGATPSDSL